MSALVALLSVLLALPSLPRSLRDDVLIADFEGTDYGAWVAAGEAFGTGPAQGALPGQMAVTGFAGKGLVNSFYKGDSTTGTLTSPELTIQRPYLRFLIGGGSWEGQTCLNLLIDGKVVRTATGGNTQSGGTERLHESGWDVREYAGRRATLQIVDRHTGGWGHINVDQIMQTDNKPSLPTRQVTLERTLTITHRYLHLPIQESAPERKVSVKVEGHTEVVNTMRLAEGTPDWWAFLEVSAWKGKTLTLEAGPLPEDSPVLTTVVQSDTLPDEASLYREPLRPLLHFSSRRGWLNDPNGLVFYQGEYHLFYQHNPYGWAWGNMHWGHATSPDLVHWKEHGDVLAPDTLGAMFSGSAVVDWKNTSGFGKDGKPPLVLLYTAAGSPTTQCVAYSTDGRTFTKYSGNPVIAQITDGNRDPKVFWHEASHHWVMVLYVGLPGNQHTVYFFTSPNLKDWTKVSVVSGSGGGDNFLYECPDFFPLPLDGDAKNTKWVLTAANSRYSIGTFDGITFTPEHSNLSDVRGTGFYAAQTYSDMPDGKRVQIGWIQAPSPGMPFNQLQSLPSELSLKTAQGPRLVRTPVKALQSLREGGNQAKHLSDFRAEAVELHAELSQGDADRLECTLRGVSVVFDAQKQELTVNGQTAPAPFVKGKQQLTVYLDRTVIEVYASDGQTYLTLPILPKADAQSVAVQAIGSKAKLRALTVYKLKSLW